ncbi:MAG TPA: amidohydrolase family protein [Candidatus Acidoferrales bacterium]|nr:amidohydrolase family protein [Candidatus Acidoferrales bacterium]
MHKAHYSTRNIPAALLATLALAAFALLPAHAQEKSKGKSPDAGKTYAIRGAKITTLAGPVIEKGNIVIRGGRIVAIGADAAIPPDAEVLDAAGLEAYPGMFDAVDQVGLQEIGAVAATVDSRELGEFNPQLVAATAVHPASEHIPVTRAAGITHVVSAPSGGGGFGGGGGFILGQASVINLSGWTIEEMLVRKSVAMVVSWPALNTRTFDVSTFSVRERPFAEAKKDYDKKVQELTDFFEEARHYQQAVEKGSPQNFTRDLKLEAMIPVLKGELPLLVLADRAHEIRGAVEFCDKQKVRMIVGSGAEALKVKDLLKQKNIPVIMGRTMRLSQNEDDPYDKFFTMPGDLQKAGIRFALASYDVEFVRRLPQQAGNAVAYGLSHDDGLKAITLYPAQILGLDKDLGTLETGKIANIMITNGDPLELRTEVKYLYIAGKPTSTDNKHKQLYEKYSKRP